MVDVFVSYSSKDRDQVRGLVGEMEQRGYSVWWDREIDAGTAFDREIEKAIDSAHCIVVVWSKNSVESDYVRTEANEGLAKGNLVPVHIEDVRPPLAFRMLQAIDLRADGANASLMTAIAKLLPDDEVAGFPCVGRNRELERLGEATERLANREGDLLLFSGEAGVGKTRMTLEAERLARAANVLVLRGHCSEVDSPPPYQPLIEQVERISRLIGPESLRESLGENAPELAKLMPELRQRYSDILPYPSLPPEQERRYLLHGIGEFIARGAAVQPLLLVFEDLQWADESTCILLRYLAERLKSEPVLMVGTYRDIDLTPGRPFARVLQTLTRERLAEDLHLSRLERRDIVEMLTRRFAAEPPPALVELVFSETEGNPFFIEEVTEHLLESGRLLTETGAFQADVRIADTEVARGVRLIIEDRLRQASAPCQDVLTVAAVAGRVFPFDLLTRAETRHDEDAILDAIEEAVGKRLLEDISQERVARYRFVHEQIRQTLLAGLSLPRRQRLHLRVASGLEAMYGATADKHASDIGHHLYHAGSAADPARTAHFLRMAGERALGAFAFEDALRQLDLAVGVLTDGEPGELAQLHALRSEALWGAEHIPDALQALELAVSLAPTPELRDGYVLKRCRMLLDIWRGAEATEDLETLLARSQDSGDADREFEVLQVLARAYYVMSLDHTGYAEKCREAYERTIELARARGAKKALATALLSSCQLVDYWPEYTAQARSNIAEAETVGRDLGDAEVQIDARVRRYTHLSGTLKEGEALLQALIARRDPIRLNDHYFRMLWRTLGQGAFERCAELGAEAIAFAYRIGALPVQYPTIQALALMQLGRFGEAWTALDEEIADEAHRFGAAHQSLGRLQYEIEVGDLSAALDRAPHLISECKILARTWMLRWIAAVLAGVSPFYADDAVALTRIEGLIGDTGYTPTKAGQAALALARGDIPGARARLAEVKLAVEGRGLFMHGPMNVLAVTALVQAAEGSQAGAAASLTEAIGLARERASRVDLWRLLAMKAQAEATLDRTAVATDRAEALSLLSEMAATVPDPAHRTAMLQGPVARRLGMVVAPA